MIFLGCGLRQCSYAWQTLTVTRTLPPTGLSRHLNLQSTLRGLFAGAGNEARALDVEARLLHGQ